MANTRTGNVVRVDTTATFTDIQFVHSILYVGAASGTVVITSTATAGNKLFEFSGSTNQFISDIDLFANGGLIVTLTNSAVVYLYLK